MRNGCLEATLIAMVNEVLQGTIVTHGDGVCAEVAFVRGRQDLASRPLSSPAFRTEMPTVMPILPAEPDLYPGDLLDRAGDELGLGEGTATRWWAVHTLPRREKDLMRRLRAMDIAHYGPLVVRRQRSPGGRTRTSYLPLFAGYVFVVGSEEDRHRVMTTHCAAQCLEAPRGDELFQDLRQIRQLIATGAALTPEALLEPGMQVRIKSGPLAGLEGTIVERRGQQRLLVAVRFLQQGASLQLEDCVLERIDA